MRCDESGVLERNNPVPLDCSVSLRQDELLCALEGGRGGTFAMQRPVVEDDPHRVDTMVMSEQPRLARQPREK